MSQNEVTGRGHACLVVQIRGLLVRNRPVNLAEADVALRQRKGPPSTL